LRKVADPVESKNEGRDSLCCGGSLGLLNAGTEEKNKITTKTLASYLEGDPEILVTACPLCKKTFAKLSPVKVMDIAELVMEAIPKKAGEVVS
jgi:Fe-S oxidoreductase